MLRKSLLLAMWAMLIAPMGLCWAQEDPPPPDGPPGGPGFRHGPGAGFRARPEGPQNILQMFDRITRSLPDMLNMSLEQKNKFLVMVKQQRTDLEEIVKKLEAQRTKFDTDLNALLTPDQQAKLKDFKQKRAQMMNRGPGMGPMPGGPGMGGGRMGDRMMNAINELNLPPEKKDQVEKIMAESRGQMQSAPQGDREAHRKIMQDMREKIKNVLSPEEFKQFTEKMRGGRGQMQPGPGGQRMGRPGRGGPENDQPPPPAPAQNESLW